MLTLPPSVRVYLATAPVDMRKGYDGLVALVQHTWKLDPFSGHLFVFLARNGARVKILAWDRGGFILYCKRLEQGRFKLPRIEPGTAQVTIDGTMLAMLLDGLDVAAVQAPKRWVPPSQRGIDSRSSL